MVHSASRVQFSCLPSHLWLQACFHVTLPIVLGGAVYVLWRDTSLVVFDWIDTFGLTDLTMSLRAWAHPAVARLPHWFLYCLPDGLWVYAFTCCMALIWLGETGVVRLAWLWVGPVMGCGGELGQLAGFVIGTFELTDLVFCLVASVLPIITIR